ncbi:MAG: efflux RND transporter permease subunit [Cyclobacteriaceae bacterium]|nr:efflux RND transporter permease subunit [Cyclobacteriaceae bacterium]MCH8517034.1 efflux RND transporter permease subunit [Cyclobacteriaceae bacterium]
MSPFRVVIVFIALSIGGLALLPKLKVNLNPPPADSRIYVSYQVSQASPNLVEQLATAPMENSFSTLSDLRQIASVSNYGSGRITLEFDKDIDLDFKRFELAMLIRQLYPKLDERVSFPTISESQRRDEGGIFMQYTINAPLAPFELKRAGEELIKKPLSALRELEAIEFFGANDLSIKIRFDEAAAATQNINKSSLINELRKNYGAYFPGMGKFDNDRYVFLKLDRSIYDLDEIEDFIIRETDEKPIRLKDIARVTVEETEPTSFRRINGRNFVSMSLEAREGSNIVDLGRKVRQKISQIEQTLPAGYEVRLIYDETEFLEKELEKVYQRSGLSILILILFIFLINRNPRYLLVLFSGILVNLCLTFLLIYFLKVPIHLYSLAGLTISFGLLVDNAIVMIDHMYKQGNKKVFLALLAASLTTISALLLVFFLPEEDQGNLLDFSLVISLALGVSLFVALFYTPAMYELIFKEGRGSRKLGMKNLRRRVYVFKGYHRVVSFLAKRKKTLAAFTILAFGLPVFMLPAKWDDKEWYNETIGSDIYQEEIRPWVDKALGGGLRLFVQHVYERSSYREPEKTKLYVNARLPYGNTLENMDFIIRDFENFLSGVDGLDVFTTTISSGEFANIEITFDEENEKGSLPYILKSQLSAKSTDWSGVNWGIYGVGQGFSTGSGGGIPSFRVRMMGYNYDELERQAEVMAEKLIVHPRVKEVNTNERLGWRERASEEYVLYMSPERMTNSGVSAGLVAASLRNVAKASGSDMSLTVADQFFPVYVTGYNTDEYSKYDLENNAIELNENIRLKPGELGELRLEKTSSALHKEDRQYIRMLSFEYFGSNKFGDQFLEEVLEEMNAIMPLGFTAEKNTWSWGGKSTQRQYGLILVLLAAIFLICAVLFENLKLPLLLVFLIPLSFVGLFLTFGWFDFYFDQGGYAAFVMLGGLTVNAGIFIIHDMMQREDRNYNRSVMKAVTSKAQPILLTVLSTCFGLIPFIIHGQNEVFWFSLAVGTIGGLIFSLIGVFLLLPVWLTKSVKKAKVTSSRSS